MGNIQHSPLSAAIAGRRYLSHICFRREYAQVPELLSRGFAIYALQHYFAPAAALLRPNGDDARYMRAFKMAPMLSPCQQCRVETYTLMPL